MTSITIKIISPSGTIFDDKCESFIFHASDGFYGIQLNHTPVTATTLQGNVEIISNGKKQVVFANKGILHFENNTALLLTE